VAEDEFEETGDGFRALRKAYEKLKSANDELSSKVKTYEAQQSRHSLEDLLKAKGVNPLVAEFYHSEDVSEQAVTAWVEKFKDVLPGMKPAEGAGEQPGQQAADPGTTVPQETQDALKRMNQVGQGAEPNVPADLLAQIEAADSPEALTALLRGR